MKNTMKLVGIIALIAVVGFSFAACSNGSTDSGGEPTKFEGSWQNEYAPSEYFYTFTGNTFTFTGANTDGSDILGTFTFTDTTITFVSEVDGTWTQGYTLSATVLTLTEIGGWYPYGPFTKQ